MGGELGRQSRVQRLQLHECDSLSIANAIATQGLRLYNPENIYDL
jgi:hypothetical protein